MTMRAQAKKAMLLAAATLCMGAATINCSSKPKDDGNLGDTILSIMTSPGTTVNSVSYTISGNGITPITGSIDVSDPGATASVLVSGIPAGTGYTVSMTANSTDGATHCTGTANFDIIANATTSVTVVLQCRKDKTTGSVDVTGQFNNCPSLNAYSAAPLTVAVGGVISVASSASDLDAGDTVTYAWTATAGSFVAAASASTGYNCTVGGPQVLTITVSDSKCTDAATINVTCAPLSCGNGVTEPLQGEQCDPPNGTTCDTNCLTIPVCGNGVVEAPAGPYAAEQCDPPNGTTCDATCHNIAVVCGNGIVQPGEQCDPPNGTTCDATCHNIAPASCGDGIVGNTAGEQCDPAPAGSLPVASVGYAQGCDLMCHLTPTACMTCEAANCDTFFGAAGAWGCGGLSGAAKTACDALLTCIRTTHCAAPAGDTQPCYCGAVSDIVCLGGGGTGACKAQYEAAAGTTDAGTIAGLFVDPSSPVGLADNEITCDFGVPACNAPCPL